MEWPVKTYLLSAEYPLHFLQLVKRETLDVKCFRGRGLGSPTFHLSRLTFYDF